MGVRVFIRETWVPWEWRGPQRGFPGGGDICEIQRGSEGCSMWREQHIERPCAGRNETCWGR